MAKTINANEEVKTVATPTGDIQVAVLKVEGFSVADKIAETVITEGDTPVVTENKETKPIKVTELEGGTIRSDY